MHYTTVALAALPVLAAAHNDPRDIYAGIPRMAGGSRKVFAEMRAAMKERGLLDLKAPAVPVKKASIPVEPVEDLDKRQGSTTTCGPGIGSCEAGLCCSLEGYCGVGIDYCAAPDCQISYGPECDANIPPSGTTTSTIARPQLGSIPYGGNGVYDCLNPGDVALTFDDGPYIYTEHILDILDEYNAKATFMITGNNLGKGQIDNVTTGYPALIERMITTGHQIASHTWGHQNFTALTLQQFQNEVYYNEMAFRNILGFFPTYLRPPYSECNDTCSTLLGDMGYHITYFDLDTQDYLNDATTLIQNSKNFFTEGMEKDDGVPCSYENWNHLVIGHDIHYQTAYNLTQFMLEYLQTNGYGTSVTVGQCLGDPAENWYRAAGSAIPTAQPTTSLGACAGQATPGAGQTTSPDNTCGATNDYSCIGTADNGGGDCCSASGYCGSTSAYCGTGCQATYGLCGVNATSSGVTTSVTTTSTTSSAQPSSTLVVSPDNTCGGTTGYTCLGDTASNGGTCCSVNGYCGSTSAYCGTGCQSAFGTCDSASSSVVTPTTTSTTSSAQPTSTLVVSPDNTCGGTTGYTCLGDTASNGGTCCSVNGYCGSTSAYCGTGCQSAFGTCTA